MIPTQDIKSLTTHAQEFGAFIKELPELVAFEKAQLLFQDDIEAKELLNTYNTKVQSLQMMQQMGQPVDKLKSEYEELNSKLETNDVLNELFLKREALMQKIQGINEELTESLGFDFATMAKPPSNCC